jgi:dTDP-glucose 4,6-dehydratase
MKKVIVTGGSGFIGSNLINFLIKKKLFVINVDKLTYSSNKYNNNENKNTSNYKFYKTDINNKKKLTEIIKKHKPKAIFNLAAETHVDRSIDDPKNFINSNIFGVFNILEVIRSFKKKNINIKLIHISTDEVYGDIKKNNRSNENYQYKPSSPYSASKASGDHLVQSYIRTYKISAIISNCCNNYGPFQFPEKLIPKMIFNIFNNKELPIYAKGQNSREWIYVDDHCEALFMLYLKGKSGESYNVGSGINLKNIDLVNNILKICKKENIKLGKKSKITFVKDRPGHDLRYALNSKKIFKELNWKARINILKGLSRTIKWYYKNKNFLKKKNNIYEKRLGLNR